MKRLFRPKVTPAVGVERPDGYPHSEALKQFMQDCKDLGAIISIIPGTNYMFLMREDSHGRLQTVNEIQPGTWVMKEGDHLYVATDEQVENIFEEIPGVSWESLPPTSKE